MSLRGMYGVDTDYRYVYIAHNYVFFRVSEDSIQIINIFHEHEDYMLALFGAGSMEETQDRYINESGMSYNLL